MLSQDTAPQSHVATLSKSKQIKLIREAYDSIPDLQDGFKDVREFLFDLNETAERRHRKGAPCGIKHGLSVKDAAKLFTVSHLLDGFAEPDKWSVDHITSIRSEVLFAQAYAKKFHAELTAWAQQYSEQFKQVDYADLMKQSAT
jgi:hypothetical protein